MGYFKVSLETPPANFTVFASLLDAQLAELATKPVSPDELKRAAQPLLEAQAKSRESNQWWIANLPTLWREPLARAALLNEAEGIRSVSASDVQQFAATVLVGRKPTVVIAKPK